MSGMGAPLTTEIKSFRTAPGRLVDVRSPGEFQQGHWPGAINIPLFSDEQRSEVGTLYKQEGRQHAIQRGLKIVGPAMANLAETLQQAGGASQTLRIYCWRGGMRSNSMAWLADLVGQTTHVLEGGYKSYRRWVLDQFSLPWPLKLLGGRTGSGKTDLLLSLTAHNVAVVDLEGLAHHRGSSFGGLGLPEQPSTEHYENRIAEVLDGHRSQQASEIWLEAESAQVGRCRIPRALFLQMQSADVLEIRRSANERVEQLVAVYGHQGGDALAEATQRISRRLGPQRTLQALEAIKRSDWHEACRAMLDYYDRCYDQELARAPERHSVDLAGEDSYSAARRLVEEGLMTPIASKGQSGSSAL